MTPLCPLDQLTPAGITEARLGDESVVVIKLGDQVCAYLNVCPHAGRPLNWAPGRFLYQHGQLVCAAHGAAFQPEDGLCIGGPCRGQSLQRIPVELNDGTVFALVASA